MRQYRLVLWVVIVWFSLIEVNSVSQRKSIKHVFVLFRSVMMKCLYLQSSNRLSTLPIIGYNTFRPCCKRFYNFEGLPFLRQLYMRSLAQQGSNPSNFARPIFMTRNYDTLSTVCVLPTNINSCYGPGK